MWFAVSGSSDAEPLCTRRYPLGQGFRRDRSVNQGHTQEIEYGRHKKHVLPFTAQGVKMFVPGQIYKRTSIHNDFGGQERGGISTPKAHPFVFIFTGHSGSQYGYEDQREGHGGRHFGSAGPPAA
jgi:hypothetical protein